MPALAHDYDYYGYARSRQGVARNATPVSRPKQTQTTHRPTSESTKAAIRNALSDDFVGGSSKKAVTKDNIRVATAKKKSKQEEIEPVVFKKKENIQKPEELKLKKMEMAKKAKAKKVQKQKAKVKETIIHVMLTGILFAMFFLICYRYTAINESFSELNAMKSSLKEKETINEQVESSIKQNTDLAYIENYAKYQLGMQKPKSSQIQKIAIDKKDKITTPIEIREETEKGLLEKLLDDFMKIID